jgi:prepilin-type N-terminal cleavage/methylation domain-containing protein
MTLVRAARSERGFTLVELMMSVMFIGILGAMALFEIGSARPALVADGVMRTVVAQLNLARETAVAQRRQIDVVCDQDNHVLRLFKRNLPPAAGRTLMAEVPFEGGVRFAKPAGLNKDTPDKFGINAAVTFGSGGTPTLDISFNSDGVLVDTAGNSLNGSIFLMLPKVEQSLRAVTVLGSIGRVRSYRWNGNAWTRA